MRYALVLAAVVLLGVGATMASQKGGGSAPVSVLPRTDVGRFQIVNPTPGYIGKTMLLDTASGETWEVCTAPGSEAWCKMNFGTFAQGQTP